MCGRFTLRTPTETLSALFDDLNFPRLSPRYNIAPTQDVLCVRATPTQPHAREAVMLKWGLIPFWSKDPKMGSRMINARSETAAAKPSFRAAFKSRRCLVLADGFYEWKKMENQKQPYYITRVDDQPFCMAGLWESWRDKTSQQAEPVETCTILTTDANATMVPLHDRMPVILDPGQWDFWLDPEFQDQQKLQQLLVPCPADWLHARAVSKMVNKPVNDGPACIEAIDVG